MTPLNTEERRSSFFLFLLFLIVSIVLVTVAAFFGMQVPLTENKLMKQQLAQYQNEQEFLQKFEAKMSQTVSDLDKINKPGVQSDLINIRIEANLDTLGKEVGTDSSFRRKIFVDINNSLFMLKTAKKDLRDNGNNSSNSAKTIQDLKDKITELNQELARCPSK